MNQNSINGIRLQGAQYSSLEACREYCEQRLRCVAVDFNLIERSCWVHVDPDDLTPDNTYGLQNVTQHRIIRTCPNMTDTPSTTTGTTATTGTTSNNNNNNNNNNYTGCIV